jgi:hypothetical protein
MRNSLQLYWLLLILLLPVFGGITLLLSVRTKNQVNRQIVEGFDSKLFEIITLTDVFLDGDQHRKLARIPKNEDEGKLPPEGYDAEDPFYLKSIGVFRQIRETTGLTYLYTLFLMDQNNLCYILDGSEPDVLSPIGTEDVLPSNLYEEMKTSVKLDRPLIKPVEEWEHWGLIKSGFAPIHDGAKQTAGFIGADIAVDIIRTREKQATLALMLSGVLGIIISIFAAIRTTRNLAQPINRLKGEVMQLAGGKLDTPFNASDISEYAHLTESYQTIRTALVQLNNDNREILTSQRLRELEIRFTAYMDSQLCAAYTAKHSNITIRDVKGHRPFSCIETRNGLLLWQFLHTDSETPNLSAKISTLSQGFRDDLNFDHWVEALRAAGYLKTINLIGIDQVESQLSYHFPEENRIVRLNKDKTTTFPGNSGYITILETGDMLNVINLPEGGSTHTTEAPESSLEIQILP